MKWWHSRADCSRGFAHQPCIDSAHFFFSYSSSGGLCAWVVQCGIAASFTFYFLALWHRRLVTVSCRDGKVEVHTPFFTFGQALYSDCAVNPMIEPLICRGDSFQLMCCFLASQDLNIKAKSPALNVNASQVSRIPQR